MNWLTRLINHFLAPVYFVPCPVQPAMPLSDEILTDLLDEYPNIPTYDPEWIACWFEAVGHWLGQVKDEDVFQRWCLRFALALRLKHPGLPLEVCAFVVQRFAQAAMVKEVVR